MLRCVVGGPGADAFVRGTATAREAQPRVHHVLRKPVDVRAGAGEAVDVEAHSGARDHTAREPILGAPEIGRGGKLVERGVALDGGDGEAGGAGDGGFVRRRFAGPVSIGLPDGVQPEGLRRLDPDEAGAIDRLEQALARAAERVAYGKDWHRTVEELQRRKQAVDDAGRAKRTGRVVDEAGAGVAAAFVSDWFVGALEPAIESLGISEEFTGLVIVGIAGNAVENVVGISLAAKGQNELAISVVKNSVSQIACFLFPVLVLASLAFAHRLTFVVDPVYLGALALTAIALWQITGDGRAVLFEGLALVSLYVVLATLVWFE